MKVYLFNFSMKSAVYASGQAVHCGATQNSTRNRTHRPSQYESP